MERQQQEYMENVQRDEEDIMELVDIVDQNIEQIVELHMKAERAASRHQRVIDAITATLGRPAFFYFVLCFVAAWISLNLVDEHIHLLVFDQQPFSWLQGLISLLSLLVTTSVLITQKRQEKIAEQRRHLDLQVNLLVEKKVTKLIDMMDGLRKDLPDIENKHDPQVEAMKEPVDPGTVLKSLNETMQDATAAQQ